MTVTKQVSLHGKRAFITPDDQLAARNGHVAGGDDKPSIVFPSPDTVAQFDDFTGDTGNATACWQYVEGDTGMSGAVVTATNGIYRITGSETQGVAPTACAAITGGLMKNWKVDSGGPKNGRLRLSARIKNDVITRTAEAGRTHIFVGFSDSGGAEMPAFDTGAGVISNAADLVGFLSSPGGDTGWSLVSVKSTAGDSGDQLVVAGASRGPSSNTYTVVELEVRSGQSDTGGTASFWIDGRLAGSISSPVNSAVALTPWIGAWCQDTGYSFLLDVDWVNISAPRDTGT